ncbi:helix-hairpin-helix domain-containing protein [Desulfobulbus sp. F5]|nr:helix-hairpin-helix domain-containing protein [Desulfobulbus sp. F5]
MKKMCFAVLFVLFMTVAAYAEININTATKDELNSLAGIGPIKAEAIVKHRQEKGPFKSIDELKNVYGIGDKLLDRIKSDITVGNVDVATEAKSTAKANATTAQAEVKAQEKSAQAPATNKKAENLPVQQKQ